MRRRASHSATVATALLTWAVLGSAEEASHEHPAPVILAPGYSDLGFRPPAPGSYALPPLGEAADGVVLDSTGRRQSLHDLMGDKIVLLSFIFTRCSDVNGCPLATFVLKGVQNRVQGDAGLKARVRLLSLSFDPEHDTPAVLDAYAAHFRQPGFDWQFLTTVSEEMLMPTLDAYGQWIIRDYDENGDYLGTISHLLRVYLIDQRRRVRNIYSTSFLHADTVANDIRTLLLELDHEVTLGSEHPPEERPDPPSTSNTVAFTAHPATPARPASSPPPRL